MSQDEQENFSVYTSEPLDIGVTEEAKEETPTEEETQSDEAVETPPTETEAKPEPEDKEPKDGNTRYQKRIDKLVKQREEYAREADALRKELEAIKSLPRKTEEVKELDPLSFESYEDYIEALNSQTKPEPKAEKKVENKEENPHTNEAQRKLDDTFDEAREKYEDFDTVVMDDKLPFTPTMVVAFTEMDNAGEVAYYLAQNKDELKRIAGLTGTKQVIELAKVADKVLNPPKVEKKVTKAPEPINPVTERGEVLDKDPSKMSFKEYEAYRNSQERKKGFW